MTTTIEYLPPATTTSVPPPPNFTCPSCLKQLPHATVCRLCQCEMPDGPFCWHCRTWTAPIDKTTCIKVKESDSTGAAQYALRGCPHCRSLAPDSFLRDVGMAMTGWAQQVSASRPPAPAAPPTESTLQPSAELPIRVKRTQTGFQISETVEWEEPALGQGNMPIVLTNRVLADTPRGKFLKDVAQRYAILQEQLNVVIQERDRLAQLWDEVCRERDDLKALLE